MTDFIQVVPNRTAEVVLSRGGAAVTVRGYSGRNRVANISPLPLANPFALEKGTTPNTTMRVTLERLVAGMPGDLGWQRVGGEMELSAAVSGFHVTWSGAIPLPPDHDGGDYRVLVTEVETFLRDPMPGDPDYSISQRDHVRERTCTPTRSNFRRNVARKKRRPDEIVGPLNAEWT